MSKDLMWLVWPQHSSMKTVSFDDEAYNLLKGAKLPQESFSDVVKRTLGRKRDGIAATAGAWRDEPDPMPKLKEDRIKTFGTTARDRDARR